MLQNRENHSSLDQLYARCQIKVGGKVSQNRRSIKVYLCNFKNFNSLHKYKDLVGDFRSGLNFSFKREGLDKMTQKKKENLVSGPICVIIK